jgi:hypothetical protein
MVANPIPYPGFIGGSYRAQSLKAAQERTVNLMPQVMGTPSAKNGDILLSTPGVTPWCVLPKGPVRGTYEMDGRMFAVGGDTVYECFSNGTATARGTVAYVDPIPVTWADNGRAGGEILLSASNNGYVIDLTANTVTLVRAGGTRSVGFLGGYFLALNAQNTSFHWSALFDGTTWPGANVYVRSNRPDPWVFMQVVSERVFLQGTESSDYWWSTGQSLTPFQPVPGGTIDHGTAAGDSLAVVGGNAVWLAATGNGKGQVMQAQGLAPRPIGNHALSFALENYGRIDDAVGATYEEEGHTFYLLTLPSARITWAWDVTVPSAWCERGTWISEENDYDYWHPTFHSYAFGMHLVGDRETSTIYRQALTLYTDVDGRPIRRVRRAPALSQGGRRAYYGYFGLEMETGKAPLGLDPKVELRYSDDGGETFRSAGFRSAGKTGKFTLEVGWHGLGEATDRVFEVVMADAIPYRLTNAFLSSRNA